MYQSAHLRGKRSAIFITALLSLCLSLVCQVDPQRLLLCQKAEATSLIPLTLGQLTRLSDLVFEGQVIERDVVEDHEGSIWTRYTLQIEVMWRGTLKRESQYLEISLRGGELGQGVHRRKQVIYGQPQLHLNDRGIFFLERASTGHWVFAGMSQGWFKIQVRGEEEWVTRSNVVAHLHKASSTQSFSTVRGDLNDMPLDQLRRLVTRGASHPKPLTDTEVYSPSVSKVNHQINHQSTNQRGAP